MKINEHIQWLDAARAFAIICVVICHITEYVYAFNDIQQKTDFIKVLGYTLFTIGRLGVPVFLMITGFLFYARDYRSGTFYKKNLLNLLVTTEIWIVIYNLFLTVYWNNHLDYQLLLKNMLFFEYVNMPHMWYMPMIIGVYIFIPVIAAALQNIDVKNLKIPFALSFIYLSIFIA